MATVEKLDWLQPKISSKDQIRDNKTNDNTIQSKNYDIILGSDIVYERSLIMPLCKILKGYLCRGRNDDCQKVAYIACTQRSRTTLDCFEVV